MANHFCFINCPIYPPSTTIYPPSTTIYPPSTTVDNKCATAGLMNELGYRLDDNYAALTTVAPDMTGTYSGVFFWGGGFFGIVGVFDRKII